MDEKDIDKLKREFLIHIYLFSDKRARARICQLIDNFIKSGRTDPEFLYNLITTPLNLENLDENIDPQFDISTMWYIAWVTNCWKTIDFILTQFIENNSIYLRCKKEYNEAKQNFDQLEDQEKSKKKIYIKKEYPKDPILDKLKDLVDKIKKLINSPLASSMYRTYPVLLAAEFKQYDIYDKLNILGIDINETIYDSKGRNILMFAVLNGDLPMIEYMIQHVNPKTIDKSNNTLLHYAVIADKVDQKIIDFLISLGIDPTIKNSDKKTFIDNLVMKKYSDLKFIQKKIKELGIPINIDMFHQMIRDIDPANGDFLYSDKNLNDMIKLGVNPSVVSLQYAYDIKKREIKNNKLEFKPDFKPRDFSTIKLLVDNNALNMYMYQKQLDWLFTHLLPNEKEQLLNYLYNSYNVISAKDL